MNENNNENENDQENDIIKGACVSPHNNLFVKNASAPDVMADIFKHYIEQELLEDIDLDTLTRQSSASFGPGLEQYQVDLLYTAKLTKEAQERMEEKVGHPVNAFFIICMEHKAQSDFSATLQLLCYIVCAIYAVWIKLGRPDPKDGLLPVPIPIVLYHGPEKNWKLPRLRDLYSHLGAKLLPFVPDNDIIPINLTDLDYDKIVGDPRACITLESLKRATDGTLRTHLPSIFRHLKNVRVEGKIFESLKNCTIYAATICKNLTTQEVQAALCHGLGEENGMKLTDLLVCDEYIEQREAKAEAKGKAEGKAEALIQLVQWMLGEPSEVLLYKLQNLTDLNLLEQLYMRVGSKQVTTLEEFERLVP